MNMSSESSISVDEPVDVAWGLALTVEAREDAAVFGRELAQAYDVRVFEDVVGHDCWTASVITAE
jgi:hypothetical protein